MTTPRIASTPSPTVVPRRGRRMLGVAGVVLSIGLLGACSDDSDDSTEAFCETRDSLSANISGLADLSIVSEGTSGLQERVDAIRSDVSDLRENGAEVASEEIDALDTAISDLGTALSDLGGGVSATDAQALVESATSVATAAGDVLSALADACE